MSQALPISTSPARAASLSAAGTPSSRLASSTSTVGAIVGTLATIFGFDAGRKWIIRDGRTGISRTGSGAPTASGRKKSFGGRTPAGYVATGGDGQTAPVMDRRRPRFAPLWVYLFGWFAVAIAQRWLFPPDEHSVAFNVTLFFVLAAAVAVILTLLQRRTYGR